MKNENARRDLILENDSEMTLLSANGFDQAILGLAGGFDPPRLVYSVSKILKILQDEGMTYEEAREHFDFNIGGGYVGEQTPVWVEDELLEDLGL